VKKVLLYQKCIDNAGTYIVINPPFTKKIGMGALIQFKYFILIEILRHVLSVSMKK